MYSDSLIIARKELNRIFTDRRLVFMLVVLPLVLLPSMFFVLEKADKEKQRDISAYTPTIAVFVPSGSAELVDLFLDPFEKVNAYIEYIGSDEIDAAKQRVAEKDADLLIVIPENMDEDIGSGGRIDVSVYYNSVSDYSQHAYSMAEYIFATAADSVLKRRLAALGVSEEILEVYTVNGAGAREDYDLAKKGSAAGKFFALMLPYFVMIYLFSNSMKVGIDIVAGEKERGTLAVLLVNQVSRLSIVLGKMFSVMIAANVGVISSAVGLLISSKYFLPAENGAGGGVSDYTMGTESVVQFAVVVIPLALLISSLVLMVSTYARNVKEGQGLLLPVYLVFMITGLVAMQAGDVSPYWMRLAPVFNSLVVLKDVFVQSAQWGDILYSSLTSLMVAVGLAFVTLRMFNDERVLFRL